MNNLLWFIKELEEKMKQGAGGVQPQGATAQRETRQ
jgi:hypothetical protein